MQIVDNYSAQIWLGLREGYTENYFFQGDIMEEIRNFCNEENQCVTITNTQFIYPEGEEPGLVIGFINYARFPKSEAEIRNRAMKLGEILKEKAKQYRVSITFDKSIGGSLMLGES